MDKDNDTFVYLEAWLTKNKLPEFLYKYRKVDEHSLENLNGNYMWLSNPQDFNDPFDCVFNFDINFDEIRNQDDRDKYIQFVKDKNKNKIFSDNEIEQIKNSDNPKKESNMLVLNRYSEKHRKIINDALQATKKHYSEKISEYVNKAIKETSKVYSLSATKESILMWSHYSDNHKGFCIEYETRDLMRGIGCKHLLPVTYIKVLNQLPYSGFSGFGYDKNIILALYKFEGWAYEREWRFVFPYSAFHNNRRRLPTKPKAIYMGAKISDCDKGKLVGICKQKEVDLYKMELDNKEYKLNPTQISI